MMNRGANSDSIPMDLIREILSRLPAKSIARFRCVSKLWESIICRQDFSKLFHTMSASNPRLLIVVGKGQAWSIFSSPQPQNHYGKSSDFHIELSNDTSIYCGSQRSRYRFSYASGLFYLPNMLLSKDNEDAEARVICNPSTGQSAVLLPHDPRYINRSGLLGFDPIAKQFKVLVLHDVVDDRVVYYILTLGTEKMRWREIKCPLNYLHESSGIYINGVLYYFASHIHEEGDKICCFDVRSEKFSFLHVDPNVLDCFQKLMNYKGKLCGCYLEYFNVFIELHMWVLEDIEKGEWSPYAYTLSFEYTALEVNHYQLFVAGVTSSGEIVLAKKKASKPFYVFYFHPETNTLLKVEIQGVGEDGEWSPDDVHCFVDHVEDLYFDVMNTAYARLSPSSEDRCSPGTRS